MSQQQNDQVAPDQAAHQVPIDTVTNRVAVPADVWERIKDDVKRLKEERERYVSLLRALVVATEPFAWKVLRLGGEPDVRGVWLAAREAVRAWDAVFSPAPPKQEPPPTSGGLIRFDPPNVFRTASGSLCEQPPVSPG